MDKIIGVSELRKSIASIVKEVHEKDSRYIIMQHSRAKAVLLSPNEMETLEAGAERIFHEDVKNQWIDMGLAIVAMHPRHIFIGLTKRPARMAEYDTGSG